MPRSLTWTVGLGFCFLVSITTAQGADWPTWKHDARRSSAAPESLPANLALSWTRELPALEPAWPDQSRMQLDAVYEPIVVGKRIYVPSSHFDTLTAYDTDTGKEVWTFAAEGPIRFAPAAWQDRIYFACDDGYLYCLDGVTGKLLWKFRGGPSDRKILGNGRLISTWPARGAPVIVDGTVYFAAGIWPFMGIFLHAVDADTGKARWTSDGDGSIYMKQPHNSDSFASVSPQGPFAVVGNKLMIPGRSAPACYDRLTGKLLHYKLAENSKKGGGSAVALADKLMFNGGAAFDVETGKYQGSYASVSVSMPDKSGALFFTDPPIVVGDKVMFVHSSGKLRAIDLPHIGIQDVKKLDRRGKPYVSKQWAMPELAALSISKVTTLMQAGDRLYVGSPGKVEAYDLPLEEDSRPVWKGSVEGSPASLIAADGKLFVVNKQGGLYCFAAAEVKDARPTVYRLPESEAARADDWTDKATSILNTTGIREGYALAWGAGSGRLVAELARQSELSVIVVEPDATRVEKLRAELRRAGLSSKRVAFITADPRDALLPPYLASLMVSEDLRAAGIELDKAFLRKAYEVLRPYGGVACWPGSMAKKDIERLAGWARLANAKVRDSAGGVLLSREGALPGSANWTHEHADAANTRVSKDRIVKAPLGVLWFGGQSHEGVLPRHGHGPQPQVVDGRLYIEGVHMLRCMDVYTGRVLWETGIPRLGLYYDNSAHQPGANAAGTNFIATPDGVYVAAGKLCFRLDPVTGKKMSEFRLPDSDEAHDGPPWGYLNVAGDYLVGGGDPLVPDLIVPGRPVVGEARVIWPVKERLGGALVFGSLGALHTLPYLMEEKPTPTEKLVDNLLDKLGIDSDDDDPPMTSAKKLPTPRSSDNDMYSSSKQLVVMDRHTGKVLWTATARWGFRHNAICIGGGRLYAIDRLSGPQLDRMKRRGQKPDGDPRLIAFDLKTGRELWSTDKKIFGTWLSYSAERDILVEAGRAARDTLRDEARGVRAYRARTGTELWYKSSYSGPAMILEDTVLMAGYGCSLLTGETKTRRDPITGATIDWEWSRNYGCNTPAASVNLLTFRSGAAGFYDLCNDGGTGNLGGFRSSCTNNLIVANGVLSAPDYTRTCVCSYQNQTSLAFIHMPEAELWTFTGDDIGYEGSVKRVGINLGAPGDRKDQDGTLWLDHPSVGGRSPSISVETVPAKLNVFRRHSAQVQGPLPWVASSGAVGVRSITVQIADGFFVNPQPYKVILYFAEPDDVKPGQRVFDVSVQGETKLRGLDVVKEADGRLRTLVKEIKGVKVEKDLVIKLTPDADCDLKTPILSGIEILREEEE
ncbi:MAG: PQQ-binding-like beta-propeller repeat protein [Gemmataceae bacterium]